MNKKIVFLLQEHNSIDQITPLIVLLYEKKYKITLIKTIHNYNYDTDNNLIYLKNNYPNIIIIDLFLNKNKQYIFLHKLYNNINNSYSLENNYLLKNIYYFFRGVIRRFIAMKFKINDELVKKIFQNFTKIDTICVTEITNGDYNYEPLLIHIKEKGIFNIAFTHGFDILVNSLLSYNEFSFVDNTLNNHATIYADKLVVFNSLAKRRIGQKHFDKIIQIASLRFSTKWIENIRSRNLNFNIISNDEKYKLKIVLMLSAVNYNIWIEEQFRTIEVILLHTDILFMVKVHPRDISIKNKFSKIKNKNFKVIGNEISSSALIDWADIVMSIGSGIIIESIIKNKISFYMKYLHCNQIELENTKKLVHKIETRDQFVILLEEYKKNLNNNFIDQQERKEFLKDYIGNDNFEENQEKYVNLFRDI